MPANTRDTRWAGITPTNTASAINLIREILRDLLFRVDQIDTNGTTGIVPANSVTTDKIVDLTILEGDQATGSTSTRVLADSSVTIGKTDSTLGGLLQGTPTFTVGAEAANVINVSLQLKDAKSSNPTVVHVVQWWLSNAAGGAVTGSAPSGTVVIGTNGTIIAEHTAKTHQVIATNATGLLDLNITEVGAATWYANVEYAGRLYSSSAITFV